MPTSISCSEGGNVVAVAFTDDKIRIVDSRIKQNPSPEGNLVLEGEHTDIIKYIFLSPDGTILFSSG